MKNFIGFAVLMITAAFGASAQTTLVQWTFNGATAADIPGTTTSPSPVIGSGTLQLIGGATAVFGKGDGSSDPILPTTSNMSWQTTAYPVSGTADRTAGILMTTSTVGFTSLQLTFDQRLSTTANNTWDVMYTADITASNPVWLEAKTFTFTPALTGTGDVWYIQRTVDFSAFTALNDNPNAAVKIVCAFDPTTNNYLASASNKTYVTTGNTRFDLFTFTGIAKVIVQNTPPVASNVSFTGNLNLSDSLTGSYSYADAEGDLQGTSTIRWMRADDASGTNTVAINGATDKVYRAVYNSDFNKYIAFEITPVAQTGNSPGAPVLSAWQGPIQSSLFLLLSPGLFDLSKGNYLLKNWPAASTPGTFPANMVFQQFNAEPASASVSATSLWECTYNNTSKSRMLGLDDDGIGFINTSDPQSVDACGNGSNTGGYVGSAVLGLSTLGVTNATISWVVSLKVPAGGAPAREYRLRPQYRNYTGPWTNFGTEYEFTSAGATIDAPQSYSLTLPAALYGADSIFVRWIYYQVAVGGSGSRPEISLDEISVINPDAPNNKPVASDVSVVGYPIQGQSIKGKYSYIDAEGDIEAQSTFQWLRGTSAADTAPVAISGATTATYTITASDVGKYLFFGVKPIAVTGTTNGDVATSASLFVFNYGDPSSLSINEVYSQGNPEHTDANLQADWIEFYNPTTKDITLAGLDICDDGSCVSLTLSDAASLVVPANSFFAIAQSDVIGFDFGLSSVGEYVVLKRTDNGTRIDSLVFPALTETQSFGRFTDGKSRQTILIPPTKGASNNTADPQDAITGLAERGGKTDVYPVPSPGDLTVTGPDENPVIAIALLSATGQELLSIPSAGKTTIVPFKDMKSGFYLLNIYHRDGRREVRKAIRE